jgi:hypothetical protein
MPFSRFRGAALLLLIATACSGPDAEAPAAPAPGAAGEPSVLFDEAGPESGLHFVHVNGMIGEYYMIENMAAGGGFLDYDGDGDLDVYLVQGGPLGDVAPSDEPLPRDRLFRNDSTPSAGGSVTLRFTDVTESSGIDSRGYGTGVATGDYDNDGLLDVYVLNLRGNRLYRNLGDGKFEDVTEAAGVGDVSWSAAASFADLDRDGWLDLYVANYLNWNTEIDKDCLGPLGQEDYCAPASYLPVPDRLYRNRGDGTFEDVTARAGIAAEVAPGLGVVAADFDGDRWPDLYVANDGMPNLLWINQRDGTFRDEALLGGCALNADGKSEASMGLDAADFDEDGDEDLFMAHLSGETNTIYVNDGRGQFDDRSVQTALGPASRPYTGFGAAWVDYDNDGWLDVLIVNGAVQDIEALVRQGDPYPLHQRNQLFRHQGPAGGYREVTDEAGPAFERSEVSRGAAFGDVDNDGDVDVLIANNAGPARLLINRAAREHHWIGVRVTGIAERDMLGARIAVTTAGGRTLWRRAHSDGSYGAANDPRVLVGLGAEAGPASLRVIWPDGSEERWPSLEVDRWHHLRQGDGEEIAP